MAKARKVSSQLVLKSGYIIVESPIVGSTETQVVEKVLTGYLPSGGEALYRRYDPLAEDALFLKFAALDGSEKSIVRFAKRYGCLLHPDMQHLIRMPHTEAGQERCGAGELITDWQEEIMQMRRAVDLWELVRCKSREKISNFIVWSDDGEKVYYQGKLGESELITMKGEYKPDCYEDLEGKAGSGQLLKPAIYLLQGWVNDKLRKNMGVRLLWNPERRGRELYNYPYSLLGAMWYQLAQEIADPTKRKIKLCECCGELFSYDRSTRQFCSDNCRKKAKRASNRTFQDERE